MSRCLNRLLLALFLIAGAGTSAKAQTTPPILQITSPANGTSVSPGQTIPVIVGGTAGVQYSMVIVSGEAPIGDSTILSGTPPFQFNIAIPTNIVQRPYRLTANGLLTNSTEIISAPVLVSVTNSTTFSSIRVQPRTLHFHYIGEQVNVSVFGQSAANVEAEITESSIVRYSSVDQSVVTVSGSGLVKAVGSGSTAIVVTAGPNSSTVAVSVPNNIRGDLNGDGKVDINDIRILNAYLNTPANGPSDTRDLNHDGVVNDLDARILVTLCTKPGCATH